MLEIRNGKPVAWVDNVVCQFRTRHLWQGQLHALGDATTMRTALVRTRKGMPWQETTQVVTAPAALFCDVQVRNTKIQPI